MDHFSYNERTNAIYGHSEALDRHGDSTGKLAQAIESAGHNYVAGKVIGGLFLLLGLAAAGAALGAVMNARARTEPQPLDITPSSGDGRETEDAEISVWEQADRENVVGLIWEAADLAA